MPDLGMLQSFLARGQVDAAVFALRPDWLTPARFAELVRLGSELLADLGEPNRSRAADGAQASTTSFPWAS